MSSVPPIVNFKVDDLKLTHNEKKVVDKLVLAAKAIAPIYQQQ